MRNVGFRGGLIPRNSGGSTYLYLTGKGVWAGGLGNLAMMGMGKNVRGAGLGVPCGVWMWVAGGFGRDGIATYGTARWWPPLGDDVT